MGNFQPISTVGGFGGVDEDDDNDDDDDADVDGSALTLHKTKSRTSRLTFRTVLYMALSVVFMSSSGSFTVVVGSSSFSLDNGEFVTVFVVAMFAGPNLPYRFDTVDELVAVAVDDDVDAAGGG